MVGVSQIRPQFATIAAAAGTGSNVELALRRVHAHRVPRAQAALQQREREAVGQLLLDHPAQRARAVRRVVAQVAEQLPRGLGQRHLHAALAHARDHVRDLQLDDLPELLAASAP